MLIVTREFIEQGRSESGGYNKEQVYLLGADWPLREGWIDGVVRKHTGLSDQDAKLFLEMRGVTRKRPNSKVAREQRKESPIPDRRWLKVPYADKENAKSVGT